MFKTGLRISEFTGLTVRDIDLKKKTINIDHQLQRTRNMEYVIETTKTGSGTRILPMSTEVYACFSRIIANRKPPKSEPNIQGKVGFLFFDKNGMPLVSLHWEKYFQHIREKYNKIYKDEMPIITPHVCRHTYCTNMINSGINPVYVSALMGHSNSEITLNTYTHISPEDLKAAIDTLEKQGKLKTG